MKLSLHVSFILALCGLFFAHVSPLMGQTTAAEPKVKKIPFHGKLLSVDQGAQTITIAGKTTQRVFHLLPTTKIIDGSGNPSSLAAAVAGEDVGGSYSKDAAGNMNLNSVRFGAKVGSKAAAAASTPAPAAMAAPAPETPAMVSPSAPAAMTETAPAPAAAPAAKPKKQSFSGTVVSVDAASSTLVVHGKTDQTFTVTPTTKITGAANLAAVAVGAKVGGSYIKSADGSTLTLSTLKVK